VPSRLSSAVPAASPAGRSSRRWLWRTLAATLALLPVLVWAQVQSGGNLALINSTPGADGGQTWSLSIQTLLMMTMLSFIPAMILMMTSFTRLIIVLSLLRNAMGTGSTPPNQILVALALFLTFYIMAPVFDRVYEEAYQPLTAGTISLETAVERGIVPFKTFMLNQTRETDLSLFAELAELPAIEGPEQVPLRVLVPAFVTSELKTAFQIGFTIFIPFLIIDLVVASVLMALGMMMVPPVTIALPFKLMLFVLADGWHLLLGSLARSFYQ
jgi:flagellar biosynthetic protein FliP